MILKFKKIIMLVIFMILITLSIPGEANATEKDEYVELSDDVKRACDKALETIAAIKQDDNACVGNIYNVIDESGDIEGYSLGFFVDDTPYGYAIYSLEKDCILEFSYYEGLENIYLELEDKAGTETTQIDENSLTDGLVYDGLIDYYIVDDKGVTLSSSGNIDELSDNQTKIITESIEEYNNLSESVQDSATIAGNYYGSDLKWQDLPALGSQQYCEVPDYGLSMFGISYYTSQIKKYCCIISSAVGCMNWMGLYNNNVLDSYNYLWNMCTCEDRKEYTAENDYYSSSAYDSDVCNIMDSIFAEKGVSTRTSYKYRPTFNDFINSFLAYDGKESHPAMLSIGGNYINQNGESKYRGHSVIALSCYCTTYQGQSNYIDYLGFYNNWQDWQGTIGGASVNLRYINYSSLMSENDVFVTGTFFNNLSSRNIKLAKTSNITALGYDVSCIVPRGTAFVFFPTWSVNNGGDDVLWRRGTVNGVSASIHITTEEHNNESSAYATDIYAYDGNMRLLGKYQTLITNINRNISNIQVVNKSSTAYTVRCTLPTGTATVKFPTWTISNNQDDLIWYEGTINGSTASKRIYISNHNNEKGTYVTDIYAYDSAGNILSSGRAIVEVQ